MTVQDNVKDFIKQYVEFGDVFKFNDEGYLVKTQDDTIITLNKPDGTAAPITMYDPTNARTDTIVLNPFVEGMNNSEVSRWFYELRSMVMSRLIFRIMEGIITKAIECKDNSIEDKNFTSAEINTLQPYIAGEYEVDSKMLKELNALYSDAGIRNFFNIYYSRKDNSCVVHVGLFDENITESLGKKVRKRTLPIFTKMILHILGVSDLSELKVLADIQGCAKFHAYTKMYIKLLRQLKKFWSFQTKTFDFKRFFSHMDSFHEYYNTAKMLISVPTKTVVKQQAPWEGAPSQMMTPIGNNPAAVDMRLSGPQQSPVGSMMPIGSNMGGMSMTPINSNPMIAPQMGMNTGIQNMQPIVPGMMPQPIPTQMGMQPVPMGMDMNLPIMPMNPGMQNQSMIHPSHGYMPMGMNMQNSMISINEPIKQPDQSAPTNKSPFLS